MKASPAQSQKAKIAQARVKANPAQSQKAKIAQARVKTVEEYLELIVQNGLEEEEA